MKNKIIITLIVLGGFTMIQSQNLKNTYKKEVELGVKRTPEATTNIITEADLDHLPIPVQNYLKYVGVVGKPHVHNVKIEFKGVIRGNPEDPWMNFTSEQYNFFDESVRAFYIKAKKMGIPANGLHLYKNEQAYMKIKLLGLFKIVDVDGAEMNQSETVTFFNDICFFAPARLVDLNVEWKTIDDYHVSAKYTNGAYSIGADLYFNEVGQLINFSSDDRYELNGNDAFMKRRWFTPVDSYREMNGYMLPVKASACYERPEGAYSYGEFELINVLYNCSAK